MAYDTVQVIENLELSEKYCTPDKDKDKNKYCTEILFSRNGE